MQFILDNILASIIAGSLFLIIVSVNHRTQGAVVETSIYYALKKQEYNFIEFMKHDFQNVHEVRTTNGLQNWNGNDSTFAFVGEVRDTESSSRRIAEVQYRYRHVQTRDGVKLYQVERHVDDGTGTMKPAGKSMSTLTGWQIQAMTEANQEISDPTNLDQAAAIGVRFESASPVLQEKLGNTLPQTRWKTTFRPQMLQEATL